MAKTVRAYHFVGKTLRDGRPIPKNGVWLKHKGEVSMCNSGLHASKHPFDALNYAPGNVLCLVECRKVVEKQDDKLVCRERKIVKRFDAEVMLRKFARECALSVADKWDMPEVVAEYLKTGKGPLRSAAWSAAASAAESAARAAAASAETSAATSAETSAAWAAAWAAATWAAASAAESAATKNQRTLFAKLVNAEFRKVK